MSQSNLRVMLTLFYTVIMCSMLMKVNNNDKGKLQNRIVLKLFSLETFKMLTLGHSVEHTYTHTHIHSTYFATRGLNSVVHYKNSSLMQSITNARLHKHKHKRLCVALHASQYDCCSDALKPSFETSAWTQLHA